MSVADLVAGFAADPLAVQQAATAWAMQNASTVATWAVGIAGTCAVGGLAAGAAAGRVKGRLARRRARREDRELLLRWMGGLAEAKAAGLARNPRLRHSGVVLGRIGRTRLTWVDQEPVLITGGTRSGKGVGLITPTLLAYGGPLVSYDGGKGDAFADTSGWRRKFSHVLNLDLTDPDGVCWNALDEVRPEFLTRDVENLVQAVPKPADADGHFEPAGDNYMGAVIIHVLLVEPESEKNMAGVLRYISRGDEGARRIILAKSHPTAVARAMSLFGDSEADVDSDDGRNYRQSVYNSARVRLKAFEDDTVAKVTSRSDFRLADLLVPGHDGRPVTLYLSTPASDDDRVRPIVSMFLSMLMQAIMANPKLTSDGRRKERRGLMLIDEFPSLRMPILETAITKIVGCKWTMMLGTQSLSALDAAPYGPKNQFRENIRCSVHFASNDEDTQRSISHAVGDFTDVRESTSRSSQPGRWGRGKTVSVSESRRPILSQSQVRELRDGEEVILVRGQPAILAKKIQGRRARFGKGEWRIDDPALRKRMNCKPAPMRRADGTYPDLPWPTRRSPWEGVTLAIPASATAPVADPPWTGMADDLPPAPDWEDGATDWAPPVVLPVPRSPARPRRVPRLPPEVAT